MMSSSLHNSSSGFFVHGSFVVCNPQCPRYFPGYNSSKPWENYPDTSQYFAKKVLSQQKIEAKQSQILVKKTSQTIAQEPVCLDRCCVILTYARDTLLRENLMSRITSVIDRYREGWRKKAAETKSSLYIQSQAQLPRSLVYTPKDEIYILLTKTKLNDVVVGAGTFKKVKLAVDYKTGELFATAVLSSHHESKAMSAFQGVDGFLQLYNKFYYNNKKGTLKRRVIMDLYPEGSLGAQHFDLLSWSAKKNVMRQLVQAVRCMHARGWLHRDLKMENILFQSEENGCTVVIGDFGAACRVDDWYRRLKHSTTALYASPEYVRALVNPLEQSKSLDTEMDSELAAVVTEKLDAWSLGCIFYMLCIGPLPWISCCDEGVFEKIVSLQGDWFHEQVQHLPVDQNHRIIKMIQSMLELDPHKRLGLGGVEMLLSL